MEICQSSSVVERFLGKKEVVGPIPTFGSKIKLWESDAGLKVFLVLNLRSSQDLILCESNDIVPLRGISHSETSRYISGEGKKKSVIPAEAGIQNPLPRKA